MAVLSGLFNVVLWDVDGFYRYVLRDVSAQESVTMAKKLVDLAKTAAGFDIDRVQITDSDDSTNLLWERGKGITYPTPEMRQKAREEQKERLQ